MTYDEIIEIMVYVYAEHDIKLTKERIAVWVDQFNHVDFVKAKAAAKILVTKKTFGAPKISDFVEALTEIQTIGIQTWAAAWDKWVLLANKFGRYQIQNCLTEYQKQSPEGFIALGTAAKEYFDLQIEQIPTFRAQFRQRFEAIEKKETRMLQLPPDVKKELGLESKTKQIDGGSPQKLNNILTNMSLIKDEKPNKR